MERWFGYETGMAWCESQFGKYQIVPFVAEFANTVSNLPLILFPLLNVLQLRPFIARVNPLALAPHLLLAFNGLASAYYHATLSLFGQLVDELLILHILSTCTIAFLPVFSSAVPQKLRSHVQTIRFALLLLSMVISVLCFLKPSLNAFALMTFSLPGVVLVYLEGTRNGMPETRAITRRIFLSWTMALACWLADRLVCDLLLQLGAPYFHAVWHLLSAFAAYNVFLLFSYLDIKRRSSAGQHSFGVRIRYFPPTSSCGGEPKEAAPLWTFPYLCLEDGDGKQIE